MFAKLPGIEGYNIQGEQMQWSLEANTDTEIQLLLMIIKCLSIYMTLMTREPIQRR